METIAIPVFGNRVSPRLDYTESLQLVKIENGAIQNKEIVKLLSLSRFEKINMLIRIHPNVIICDGISELSNEKLTRNNIKVFPWIHGEVDAVIDKYLKGKLKQSDIQDKPNI